MANKKQKSRAQTAAGSIHGQATGSSNIPSQTRALWCLVNGDSTPFKVSCHTSTDIDDLKNLIKEEGKNGVLSSVDAKDLTLWKLQEPPLHEWISLKPSKTLADRVRSRGEDFSAFAMPLEPVDTVFEVFPVQPAQNGLHIIVQAPSPATGVHNSKRPRLDNDITNDILSRWGKRPEKLPSLTELRAVIDEPLADDEKIPLSEHDFSQLVSTLLHDLCTHQDVQILFRVSELENSFSLRTLFTSTVTASTPPENGTEASFHQIWDVHIRQVLGVLLPNGVSIRDSSLHTSTQKLRPDFGFLLSNICLFRGEEKSPTNVDDPKAELCDKLTWIYSPAPYVFAYYAVGTEVTLSAICAPRTPLAKPYVQDLAVATLRLRKERIMHLRRIIRLSRYIPLLLKLIGYRSDPEFLRITRNDKSLEVGLKSVKKTYHGDHAVERVRYLENIYRMLGKKKVPHVDHLVHFVDAEATVYLGPKGIPTQPSNEMELLEALVCVLQAIEVLHQDPPLFHRDIRWANVIRSADDRSSWFLIDWEDAAGKNNVAATHLHCDSHSPRLYLDNHGGEVDVWGVGLLIKESRSFAFNVSAELLELGRWMQDGGPTSQDALATIINYQREFGERSTDSEHNTAFPLH